MICTDDYTPDEKGRYVCPYQAERDRFANRTAERRIEYERLSGVTRQGVRTGYLISDEGVEALLTGGSGLERREYHASAFSFSLPVAL